MKKICLILMLCILSNLIFANSSEAIVTVKATLVDEELVIGGANNKPMIIDFGNIENNSNGKLDLMIQYSGIENNSAKIDLALEDQEIELINDRLTGDANKSLTSNIKLTKESEIAKGKNSTVSASIKGDIKKNSDVENGLYAGIAQLNITVIPM